MKLMIFFPPLIFWIRWNYHRKKIVPKIGKVNTLLLSYQKNKNKCLNKMSSVSIINDNVLDFFDREKHIKLKPSLVIAKLPEINEMVFDGQIELQIGLKLPF
jgi:hypothetical protein